MKLFRKLNQLTDFKYERYLPTAFDNSLSLLEKIDKVIEFLNVVIETTNKIGEYVEEKTNEQDNKIRDLRNEFEKLKEYLLNGGLENDVVKVLNQWLNDGTLADVINNEVFNMKANSSDVDMITYFDNLDTLQESIDYVHSMGGGKLQLKKSYDYNDRLDIKENVHLVGSGTVFNVGMNTEIFFHSTSSIENVDFEIPFAYNKSLIIFDNGLVNNRDKVSKSLENALVSVKSCRFFSEYTPTTTNKNVFKLFAKSQPNLTPYSGFWGVEIKDIYIDGVNLPVWLKTENTGWLTGNTFEHITVDHFDTAVLVERSEQSLTVSNNYFKYFKVQSRDSTRDIFKDNSNANYYSDVDIYDIFKFPEARTGNVKLLNPVNMYTFNKTQYGYLFGANRYYLLGRFSRFTAGAHSVAISMKNVGGFDTVFFIHGQNGGTVEVRENGFPKLKDMKFYKKELPNGEYELYVQSGVEVFTHIMFDGVSFFNPTLYSSYTDVVGLQELTKVLYDHNSLQRFINAFDLNNGPVDFPLGGPTISKIQSTNASLQDVPELEGKPGTLFTYIADKEGSYGYSIQEYHVFNSPTRETYKRQGVTADTWNRFVRTSRDIPSGN